MNCIGSNLTDIKDSVEQGIKSILQKNGGTLNHDNTVNLGSTKISEIAEYLDNYFDTSVSQSSWLIKKGENIYYQFPTDVEAYVNEANKINEETSTLEFQTSQNLEISQEIVSQRTVEENLLSESSPSSLLFSPVLSHFDSEEVNQIIRNNKPSIGTSPTNFKQWVEQKRALLEDIKKDFKNFKRSEPKGTNYYRKTVSEYERTILQLGKNIKDIENYTMSPNEIFSDIIKEINYLERIVKNLKSSNPEVAALERRLDILSKMFLHKKLDGDSLDQPTKDSNIFFVEKDGHPELEKIRDKVSSLLDTYSQEVFNTISSILTDNLLIKEYEAQGKMEFTDPETGQLYTGEAATLKIVSFLEDIQGTNWASMQFLGSATGAGIIGQLARIVSDVNLRETQSELRRSQKIIEDNVSDFKRSELTVDIFEQEDEFGVSSGYLVHKYSPSWFKYLAAQRKERKLFSKDSNQKMREISYRKMMLNKKNNEIVLDFTKIKSIRDKFSNHFLYKDFFTSNDAEMESYENNLRNLLGDLFFNDLIKQQILALEDYQTFYDNNSIEFPEQVEELNPVSFLNHFNSSSFTKPTEDGSFLFPDYVMSVPLDKRVDNKGKEILTGFYSEKFKVLENNESAYNIWQALADQYQNFINPVLSENGINVAESGLDLAKIDDFIQSVIWNSLSQNKRIILTLKNIFKKYVSFFADPSFNKLSDNAKVRVKYSDTLKKRAKDMANVLSGKSLEELMKMAFEEKILKLNKKESGKSILDSDGINLINEEIARLKEDINNANSEQTFNEANKLLNSYINGRKKALATSISNNKFYSHANIDILRATEILAEACTLAKANKKTLDTVNLLENYVRNQASKSFNDSGKKQSLDNLASFLSSWTQTNILGNINHKDPKAVRKFMGKKVGRAYNKVDKVLKSFLENEVKNVDGKEEIKFSIGNISYEKRDNKFFKERTDYRVGVEEKKEIGIEEFKKEYSIYIGDKISKLGEDYSIGAVLMGTVRIKAVMALALNMGSGVINRIVGNNMNRIFAASGRFGFNSEQLQKTKNFLAMSNIDRVLYEGIGLPSGTRGAEHAQKIRTFKLFVNSFGLIQNRLNEIDGISDTFSREGFSVMDFAVNFAEFHNQGEIIGSILQNYYLEIKDNNGNIIRVPIFDGDTQEWVYKPGTLILKDEYRTEENIRIWENFASSKDGNNPHLTALFQMQAGIERSQGNYYDRDKTMVMGSSIGRTLMMFKRYMGEQFFNQYGVIEQDIILGQEKYEGRTRILFRHGPSTAVLLGTLGFVTLGPWMGALAFTGGIGLTAYRHLIKRQQSEAEQEVLSLIDEVKLGVSLLSEVCLRAIDRPFEAISRGKNKELYDIDKIIYEVDSKLNLALKEKERRLLKESAQDVSNSLYCLGVAATSLVALRFVGEIVMGVEDDDDEETYKAKMKNIEQISNMIINRHSYLTSDFIRTFHPQTFLDDSKPTILATVTSIGKMLSSGQAYFKEEGDLAPFLLNAQRALPVVIPNTVADGFLKEGKSPIQDPKIYEEPWWISTSRTEEQNADKANTFQRKKVKEEMVDYYKEEFIKELENRSEEEQKEFVSNFFERNKLIEKYANEAADKQMNKMYRKKNGESSTDYYNRVNLKEERKKWENKEESLDFSLYEMEAGMGYQDRRQKKSAPIYY